VNRDSTARVLSLVALVELALTVVALVSGALNPDFAALAASIGISLLFIADFLKRGQAVLLTLLGIPVGFALGQGYVLWSDRGAAEQGDALFVGAVGALVGLLFGYVATSFLETRRRNERG
jgi:hypothetical protein